MASKLAPAATVTHTNDVIIVQLPFDFETLFVQTGTKGEPGTSAVILTQQADPEPEPPQPSNLVGLAPRYRRKLKTKKSIGQHLEELNSPLLKLSESGKDIYCIPCETNLTEFGKVKKSSIKLHLRCKRHEFNLKQLEKKSKHFQLPPEVKKDETLGFFMCTLCGKAISSEMGDVRRHCSGKRHQHLLSIEIEKNVAMQVEKDESMPTSSNLSSNVAGDMKPAISAREYNNEFVYDVLDYVMRTNNPFASLKHMKKLLTKWTTMKLPALETIRRNHLPRYLRLNPEVARRREEAAIRRANRQQQADATVSNSGRQETLQAEIGEDGTVKRLCIVQQEGNRIEIPTGSVAGMELEQALNALNSGQEPFISMSDFTLQVTE